MNFFAAVLMALCALALVHAQRPSSVCIGPTDTQNVNEGAFLDMVSSAPSGYRVSIHVIGYQPDDTATYVSEFYFKSGTAQGWETTRWPWILHYSETVPLEADVFHEFEPIPVVIGEQPVGYVLSVDNNDDIRLRDSGNSVSDGFLTLIPGEILETPPIFSAGSLDDVDRSPVACFTHTLDQFGSFAVVSGGHRLQGFDGSELTLPAIPEGVYALISHRSLAVNGRMCGTRAGSRSSLCEAGLVLADGHRFVVEALGAEAVPVLEVHLPTGETERLELGNGLGTSVHALPLELDGGDEAEAFGVRSQLFASAFENNEEALQDAAVARHVGLGDLEHLDLASSRITARVLLTTWAFEVTLLAVEDEGQASLLMLSHRHTLVSSTEGDVSRAVASAADAHGLLGATAAPVGTVAPTTLESFVMEDSVLATEFSHSLFQH